MKTVRHIAFLIAIPMLASCGSERVDSANAASSVQQAAPLQPTLASASIKAFIYWMNNELKEYLQELDEPNYWESPPLDSSLLLEYINYEAVEEFTPEEQIQIKSKLSELSSTIEEKFELTKEQLNKIQGCIQYLTEAVDRTNKTDWKAIAVSMFISAIVNLAVDTSTAYSIYALIKSCFANLLGLPITFNEVSLPLQN